MHRSDGVNLAVGALLVGIGAVILGLLSPTAATVVAAVCTAVGFYLIVCGVYLGWPSPATAAERAFRPRLEKASAKVLRVEGNFVHFEIVVFNAGHGDARSDYVNVLVPEFVYEIERCSENGEVGREEHKGSTSRTSEPLLPGCPHLGSIFWNGSVGLPGRRHRFVYFRVAMAPVRDFPMRFDVTSPDLGEKFTERFELSVAGITRQQEDPGSEQEPDQDGQGS